jgi:type II secretory pathway pseudopilin PulG
MVVISIIGIVAATTLYGLKTSNTSQSVDNAQKEFVSNLRAIQNKVDNGDVSVNKAVQEIGVPASGTSYTINGSNVVTLPPGVAMTNKIGISSSNITLCLSDRNLNSFDSINKCSSCSDVTDVGYVCNGGIASSPASVVVTFTSGSISKTVTIKGSGMRISSIDPT